jgi:uncharacterized protein YndB with AHSA1/START domain
MKKLLKFVLASLLLLVVVVAGFAAYVVSRPNDYAIERTETIAAPPEKIFALVNDMKAWEKWSPWKDVDPQATITFSDPSIGPGASFSWKGNREVGEGTLKILDSKSSEKIDMEIWFVEPMQNKARETFTFKPVGDKTEVTWAMSGSYDTFGHKAICTLMNMDKILGGKFAEGLENLKRVTEAK